jgi:hypothetical protein
MPLMFLEREKHWLNGKALLLFVDNSVALFSYVKGCSGQPVVGRIVQTFHLSAIKSRVQVWFEYIPSKQNWSDGISRHGLEDEFAANERFSVRRVELPASLLEGSLEEAFERL